MFPHRRRDGDENKLGRLGSLGNGEAQYRETIERRKSMSSTDRRFQSASRVQRLPGNLKVAYQGEPGAYSEAAALTAY